MDCARSADAMARFNSRSLFSNSRRASAGNGEACLATVVLVEAVLRVKVLPAITGEDRAVHFGVQRAQAHNIGIGALGVVEETVSLGQAQVAASMICRGVRDIRHLTVPRTSWPLRAASAEKGACQSSRSECTGCPYASWTVNGHLTGPVFSHAPNLFP